MVIAVNTRLLIKNKLEGIGWFSLETLKRITTLHPEHDFIFIFDRPYSKEFIFSSNIKPVILFPPTRHPLLWYIWFELRLPRLLRKLKADLFFSPDGFIPLNSKIKTITTIHDINFAHRPKDLPVFTRWYYNYYFLRIAKKADRIITVSQYSKNDIANTYSVSTEKIDVVYNGSNNIYSPVKETEKTKIKKQLTSGNEYFLFVGALNPRKNINGLLKAFDLFKKETKLEHKLVIVGEKMFRNKKVSKALSSMKYSSDVIFSGRLSPVQLKSIMASAQALTFVPFFEGFGIPLLEAMYCEIPLLASNVTSLPEVAGDAAIYANPFSTESIANGMVKIALNENLRKELIEKGKKQREQFSWDKTAKRVWKSLEQCFLEDKRQIQ